ncbi:ABC transporter substrate-binding protein [Acutalibacter sp. 1XD8-36]|uniref:ABC transporter substrate-binding protein n=1 Tax=Acutalibacter sp. 1XD8-36 TaxID=2320852 RepID=UPI001412EE91|nr:ABC transporter substrate-binding protein [Acutalibacter sp. 1XD8-36]
MTSFLRTFKRCLSLALMLCLTLAACGGGPGPSVESAPAFSGDSRVVCLYSSYAEAWLLAGGTLVGVTDDAVNERKLDVGDAEIIGTVKEPNTEAIIALEPDLVIFSEDIAAQVDMTDVLTNAGITCSGYRVDTFEDYAEMMRDFCRHTGRGELLKEYVDKPAEQIESVRKEYGFESGGPKVLLIRAFSTGIKAKTDDELAGAILLDLGCQNIADEHPSMLEDLSLEEVIDADPDYIFVTTMGKEEAALSFLEGMIEANPAWDSLTAIKEGRFHVLPKDLFHYKPNHRWGESYEYLGELLSE